MLDVKDNAVRSGFDHLETIANLHFHRTPEEQLEAIGNVLESFGMDEEARNQLLVSVVEFIPEERRNAVGWVIMGFVAGLSSAAHASEPI